MRDDLQDMIKMSNAAGCDPRLVQGGGGNTSVKTGNGRRMYIKASGTSLAEMEEGLGYRLVEVEPTAAMLEDPELAALPVADREHEVLRRLLASCVEEGEGRPSVETSLHAVLGRCVLHTHPSVVNGLLSAVDGRDALRELFGGWHPPYLYVPFTNPGYELAVLMHRKVSRYREQYGKLPQVIFLENHGLFVSVDDPDVAMSITLSIFGEIEAAWQRRMAELGRRSVAALTEEGAAEAVQRISAGLGQAFGEILERPVQVRHSFRRPVEVFMSLPNAEELAGTAPVMPDQEVYCKGPALWLELPPDVEEIQDAAAGLVKQNQAGTDTPRCVVADGVGLFAVGASDKLADSALATMGAMLETLTVAGCFGGARGMKAENVEFLRDWEVVKYREELVSDSGKKT